MMTKVQYAIDIPGAMVGDDITATILFRNRLVDLIEGLEHAADSVDNLDVVDIDAALAIGDAIEFLTDVMRTN